MRKRAWLVAVLISGVWFGTQVLAQGLALPGANEKKAPQALDEKAVLQHLNADLGQMSNWALYVQVLISLVLAMLIGAVIGYHPKRKVATLEEADQPKIFIMYCVVGSVVAQIVSVRPEMAFVIFGIGGLFRFRTDVGPARDTGRLILVTCLGLCSGLGIYVVTLLGTVFAWLLIYCLDAKSTHKVMVKGIEQDKLAEASNSYREVLVENGFILISEKKNVVKKQVSFVFRAPGQFERDELESLFKDIPPKLQGAVDWESI